MKILVVLAVFLSVSESGCSNKKNPRDTPSETLESFPITDSYIMTIAQKNDGSILESSPVTKGIFKGCFKRIYGVSNGARYEAILKGKNLVEFGQIAPQDSFAAFGDMGVGLGLGAMMVGSYAMAHGNDTTEFMASDSAKQLGSNGNTCAQQFASGQPTYDFDFNDTKVICRKTRNSYIVEVMPLSTYKKIQQDTSKTLQELN